MDSEAHHRYVRAVKEPGWPPDLLLGAMWRKAWLERLGCCRDRSHTLKWNSKVFCSCCESLCSFEPAIPWLPGQASWCSAACKFQIPNPSIAALGSRFSDGQTRHAELPQHKAQTRGDTKTKGSEPSQSMETPDGVTRAAVTSTPQWDQPCCILSPWKRAAPG